jgi:hypothetical protein
MWNAFILFHGQFFGDFFKTGLSALYPSLDALLLSMSGHRFQYLHTMSAEKNRLPFFPALGLGFEKKIAFSQS